MKSRRITLEDVAGHAGVGNVTVSCMFKGRVDDALVIRDKSGATLVSSNYFEWSANAKEHRLYDPIWPTRPSSFS